MLVLIPIAYLVPHSLAPVVVITIGPKPFLMVITVLVQLVLAEQYRLVMQLEIPKVPH